MQIIFFPNVLYWDEGQKSSMSLKLFEPLRVAMSLYNYKDLLGASFFEHVTKEGCYLNITSKFLAKINIKKSQT